MGFITRLFGGPERSSDQVEAELASALRRVDGVTGHDLTYRTDASGGGSLKGHVQLASADAFEPSLAMIGRVLGPDGGRTAIYAVGRLADGTVLNPTDVGFRPRPSGAELRERYDLS